MYSDTHCDGYLAMDWLCVCIYIYIYIHLVHLQHTDYYLLHTYKYPHLARRPNIYPIIQVSQGEREREIISKLLIIGFSQNKRALFYSSSISHTHTPLFLFFLFYLNLVSFLLAALLLILITNQLIDKYFYSSFALCYSLSPRSTLEFLSFLLQNQMERF